ncbi:MAG: Ig-like domain-containing protein [Candidatus Hydrothermarchaeota archaeon]
MMKTGWYAILLTLVLLVVGTVFGVVLGGFISSLQMEGNRTPELNASLPTQPPTTTPAPTTTPPTYVRTTTPPPSTTPPPAVTTAPPAVTLITPTNNSNQSNLVAFNFTATGGRTANLAVTLFIAGQANFTGTIANATFNVTTLAISAGLHTWSVSAGDGLLNGTSETRIFRVDTTAPAVAIMDPANDSNFSTANVTFTFTALDNSLNTTLNFTFYLAGAASFSGTTQHNALNAITLAGIPAGLHNWSVNVSDFTNNTGASETRFFRVNVTVDTTPPVVTLVSPANDSNFSGHSVTFNFTVIDDNSNITLNFTFYLDGTANFSGTIANGTFNVTTRTIQDGLHSWSVNVSDAAGNSGMSATRFFRVNTTAPPVLYIASPQNTTYANISIQLNVSGNLPVDTWQYSLNGTANVTFTPNITFTAAEGANNIVVTANGTSGNRNSTTVYFTVDTTPPLVTVLSPANTSYPNSSVWLNFIVTLNENSGNVTALLDATTNFSLTNSSGNWNFLLTSLTEGAHNVRIFANDSLGNMNSTQIVYFTVSGP